MNDEKRETVKTNVKEVQKVEKVEKVASVESYVMNATHLSWGQNGKNHFYSAKKPLITRKVMGKYSDTLDIWIENGWVVSGKY